MQLRGTIIESDKEGQAARIIFILMDERGIGKVASVLSYLAHGGDKG